MAVGSNMFLLERDYEFGIVDMKAFFFFDLFIVYKQQLRTMK